MATMYSSQAFDLLPGRVRRNFDWVGALHFTWGLSSCVVLLEPALFDILGVLILFCLTPVLFGFKAGIWRATKATVLSLGFIVIFAVLHFVALVIADKNLIQGIIYSLVTFALMLFGIYLGRLIKENPKRFELFIRGYVVAAVFSALVALFSMHPYFQATYSDLLMFEGRPKAFFKDPNVLGPYLIPAAAILYLLWSKQRTIWLLTLHALVVAGVFITGSRGAWINIAITIFILLVAHYGSAIRYLFRLLIITTIAFVIGWSSGLVGNLDDIVAQYAARLSLQDYDTDRFQATSKAIKAGLENLNGVGPTNIRDYAGNEPHNTLVKVFAETGIISSVSLALFLVGLIVSYYIKLKQKDRSSLNTLRICFALFVGQMINAFFVDALHWRHYWIIIFVFVYTIFSRSSVVRTYQ